MAQKEEGMSRPPELQNMTSLNWWVRLCCWLWGKQGLLWSTIILGAVISAFGAWLFTPWGTDFTKLPIGWAVKNPGIILLDRHLPPRAHTLRRSGQSSSWYIHSR